jgi:hypothetical protein
MTGWKQGLRIGWGRKLLAVLCLAPLLLSPLGAVAAQPVAPVALVRIDLAGESQLATLAEMDLQVLAQIGATQGEIAVVALADALQQQALTRLGYSLSVLDSEPAGASYYLVYALADELSRAEQVVPLLLVEGRQAVLRATPEQAARLDELGIGALLLSPHAVIVSPQRATPQLPTALTPSPVIQRMVDQITSDTLSNYVGQLSGEQSVIINDLPYTILTRYTPTGEPMRKATRFVYEHLQGLGLPVGYHYYILPGWNLEKRNVIAQQTGEGQPERLFLLTAHLDSTSQDPYNLAPGADDNASGSAAVMAIADVLSQYNFDCTLRYIFFTGEEQGLRGSTAYASEVVGLGEDIEAVLNLDMLGYNTPGTASTFELHTRPSNSADLAIANLFADAVAAYSISLTPQILQDRLSFSDHAPFWDRGIPAILAIEDWDDHTPDYHRTTDRLSTLNMTYYTRFVKAALATFAHMGCLLDGELGGTVSDAVSGAPLAGVNVEARLNGIPQDVDQTATNGAYRHLLHSGSYTVAFSAPNYRTETVSSVQVVGGERTTLNRSLTACETVSEVSFTASPSVSPIGEQIAFSASIGGGVAPVSFSWDFGDGSGGSGEQVTHTYTAPGVHVVTLTADNSCLLPASARRSVLVGENFFFFPLTSR